MPECKYCSAEIQGEERYLDHLREEHYDELGRIDRRRVDDHEAADEATDWLIVGVIALVGILLAGGGYVLFVDGSADGTGQGEAGAPTPHDLRSVHVHGGMVVSIDGDRLDFSQPEYQVRDDYFHFEGGNGERWHVHGRGVTLQYAMETLGIDVTSSTVTYDGTTYRDSDPGTTVTVEVNGESVDPGTYVLRDGDRVRIVVDTSG